MNQREIEQRHDRAMNCLEVHTRLQKESIAWLWDAFNHEIAVAGAYKDSDNGLERGVYYLSAASIAKELESEAAFKTLINDALEGALSDYHRYAIKELRDA